MPGPEANLKKRCREWLKKHHPNIRYYPYAAYMGISGFPDNFGYIQNKPYAIPFVVEFKAPRKMPRKLQRHIAEELRACRVQVLSPCDNKEDFVAFINKLIKNRK